MSELVKIRQQKREAFEAIETCSDELKPQLEEVYNNLDAKETELMEALDLDID